MTIGQAKRYQRKVDELLCLTDVFYRKTPYNGILVIFSCWRYGNIE